MIGIAFGAVGLWLLRRWHALSDRFVTPLLPILFAYLAFALAQARFEISGVIAVLTATFTFHVFFNRLTTQEKPSQSDKERYFALWDFLADMANVMLFFVLGIEMGIQPVGFAYWVMPVGIVALIAARSVTVYGFGILVRPTSMRMPLSWQHVMNIGGLRGALCAALVLMIPHDYKYRSVFLFLALSMSLFTLIVNPLVMRSYLKKAALDE
jgi:CPA1 family monovalent cation:H+ antiporter